MTIENLPLQWRLWRGRVHDGLAMLPKIILVRHFKTIEALLFICVLISAGYILFKLFWEEAAVPPDTTVRQEQLSQATLDVLELWIEERQGTLDRGLPLPAKEYFVQPTAAP